MNILKNIAHKLQNYPIIDDELSNLFPEIKPDENIIIEDGPAFKKGDTVVYDDEVYIVLDNYTAYPLPFIKDNKLYIGAYKIKAIDTTSEKEINVSSAKLIPIEEYNV